MAFHALGLLLQVPRLKSTWDVLKTEASFPHTDVSLFLKRSLKLVPDNEMWENHQESCLNTYTLHFKWNHIAKNSCMWNKNMCALV